MSRDSYLALALPFASPEAARWAVRHANDPVVWWWLERHLPSWWQGSPLEWAYIEMPWSTRLAWLFAGRPRPPASHGIFAPTGRELVLGALWARLKRLLTPNSWDRCCVCGASPTVGGTDKGIYCAVHMPDPSAVYGEDERYG